MAQSEQRQDQVARQPGRSYHHGDLRVALIAAAEEILAERGAEGFTLRECARRAGVSPAAPAHHFGNAAGLLCAIATLGFDELSEAMEAALDRAPDESRLRAIAEAYVRFAQHRPGRFRVTFGSATRPRQHGDAGLVRAGERAFAILEREARLAVPGDAGLGTTVFVWSVVHGLANLLLDGRLDFLAATDLVTQVLAKLPSGQTHDGSAGT